MKRVAFKRKSMAEPVKQKRKETTKSVNVSNREIGENITSPFKILVKSLPVRRPVALITSGQGCSGHQSSATAEVERALNKTTAEVERALNKFCA